MTIETNFKIGDSVWFISSLSLKAKQATIKGLSSTQISFPKELSWEFETNGLFSDYHTFYNSDRSRNESQIAHTKEELLKLL